MNRAPAASSGGAAWSAADYWSIERQLICAVLDECRLEADYQRELLAVLDRWVNPGAANVALVALPILVCTACGGLPSQAVPVCAASRTLRLAAKLLDDVEDGDLSAGLPQAINSAVGLIFVTQLLTLGLQKEGVPLERVQRAGQELCHASLAACGGQAADLAASEVDPDDWLRIAQAKSGALLGWAAWAGALVVGADERALACYRDFGSSLGVLLQVADDYNGVWYPDGVGDLATPRPTLPVAYALAVAGASEQSALRELIVRARRGDRVAETQARQLLIDVGAQAFVLVVGQMQQRRAAQALQAAGCGADAARPLFAVLDRVFPALNSLKT